MRRKTTILLGLILPLAVLACGETGMQEGGEMEEDAAGDTAAADAGTMQAPGATVSLAAKGGSGISGDARLMPAGDSVRIAVSLTGLTEGQGYPAHVHTGSCSAGGGVDQPLSSVTGQAGGTGSSTTALAASVLADTSHFIQAHGSGGAPVACGDLPAPSAWEGGDSGGEMSDEGAGDMSGGDSGG